MEMKNMENENSFKKTEKTEKEERSLFNPETTFFEGQTYLDFLLSNAKDEEEKAQIEDTINNYLETLDENNEEEKDEE